MIRFSYTATNRFEIPIRTVSVYDGETPVVRFGREYLSRMRESELPIPAETVKRLDRLLSTQTPGTLFERGAPAANGEEKETAGLPVVFLRNRTRTFLCLTAG